MGLSHVSRIGIICIKRSISTCLSLSTDRCFLRPYSYTGARRIVTCVLRRPR